ncbi:MAG TPA: cupin domain-containing protein [Capillimicrobium sp.]
MIRANIADPDFAFDDDDPPGFRAGMFRLGRVLPAERLGATLYLLPPGEALCPMHWEAGEEEWLLVLEGRPTVRHAGGADDLAPWDTVCFPAGPQGVHQVRNDTDQPVRVLLWSNVEYPAVTVYPDSDKVGAHFGDRSQNLMVRRSSGVDYYAGEAEGR